MEQADHGALGLVPDRDRLRGRQQLHLAAVPREVGGRLLRQRDPALLSGADQQPLGALLVEVLGLGQRDGMGGAVDGLGQLLLAFSTRPPSRMITSWVMVSPSMVTEPNCVRSILGSMDSSPSLAPAGASAAVRRRAHGPVPARSTYTDRQSR